MPLPFFKKRGSLNYANPNTFSASPTSPEKVTDTIQDLKTSKSIVPDNLPKRIVNKLKMYILFTF